MHADYQLESREFPYFSGKVKEVGFVDVLDGLMYLAHNVIKCRISPQSHHGIAAMLNCHKAVRVASRKRKTQRHSFKRIAEQLRLVDLHLPRIHRVRTKQ